MAEPPKETGKFAFGIKILQYQDGTVSYQTTTGNDGVPIEVVILQLKTFLQDLEREYYVKFSTQKKKS